MIRFEIPFRLPGLNEYIAAMNSNRHRGNAMKRQTQDAIVWAIKAQKVPPVEKPVTVIFEWHEATKRRDKDNVAGAKKFILDALQEAKILPNDNNKWIVSFSDLFVYDKTDGVTVTLREV